MALWLDPIPDGLQSRAMAAFETGDPLGFLALASNEYGIALVYENARALLDKGIYETALLDALTASRVNNLNWSTHDLRFLLGIAERAKLRAAGDPLPSGSRFEVFRGVAGRGCSRRVRGISWTLDSGKAEWFAGRFGLPDPAVYAGLVSESDILAYTNERRESEIIVLPENVRRVRRLDHRVVRS